MPSDRTDLAAVRARVEEYLDTVRAFVKRDDACEMQDEPGYFATLQHADLRALLAALDAAEAERDRLREAMQDFYAQDVEALRLHPDIPWGIGGKSGTEHVAEWRNDLAKRIERVVAINGEVSGG